MTAPIARNIDFLTRRGWCRTDEGTEVYPRTGQFKSWYRFGRGNRWVELQTRCGIDGCTRTKVWFWRNGSSDHPLIRQISNNRNYPIALAGYESRRGSLNLINGCSIFGSENMKFPSRIESFEALHHRAVVWILNGSVPRRVLVNQPTNEEALCS